MDITRRQFVLGSLAAGSSFLLRQNFLYGVENKKILRQPAYADLDKNGELSQRIEQAYAIFEQCELCPRQCGVNRLNGEKGFCRAPAKVMVYSAHPHFGEEISLSGRRGSGTIFFSNCNLRCVFCQNWPIAHEGRGKEIDDEDLSDMMLHLQKSGCHNINLVTPTHVMPNILNATQMALQKGLKIPLVYNTSGYESISALKILDGIVDIYLPDMKFMDSVQSQKYSGGASDYPEVTQKAIIEMHRQVGLHQVNQSGIANRGLMIRHLVMPNRVASTEKFVKWVADNLPRSTYVNIMHQYHVAFKAYEYPLIWRSITAHEYIEAMSWAEEYGLTNLDPHTLKVRDFFVAHEKNRD